MQDPYRSLLHNHQTSPKELMKRFRCIRDFFVNPGIRLSERGQIGIFSYYSTISYRAVVVPRLIRVSRSVRLSGKQALLVTMRHSQ